MPLWGQPPRALHFQTLKLAKPNTWQLNTAPHGTHKARPGPFGPFFAPFVTKYPVYCPRHTAHLAAHRSAIGGWPVPNVKVGGLNSAGALGGQSILHPLRGTAGRLWPNIQMADGPGTHYQWNHLAACTINYWINSNMPYQ